MHEDYPELPDFLNRQLNPQLASSQHGGQTRRHKPQPEIIWPRAKINKALKASKRLKKQRAKERLKKQRERERRN